MRRSTVIAGAVAGAVLVAAALFLMKKVEAVAGAAEDAVYQETGTKFSYSGLPGISLFPETAVTLGDVALAPGEGAPPIITAAQMRLTLDRGLFTSGQPVITSVTLTDARINMTVGSDGKPSWLLAGQKGQAAGAKRQLPVHLVNGLLAFHDERSGFSFTVDEIEAATTFGGPDGEFTAKGGVVWKRQPVSFTLFLKSPQRLAEDGSPVDLNFSSPSLTFAFSGRAATARAFDLSGQATAKSADLRLLAQWLGSKISGSRGFQNFEISGNLDASENGLAFRQAKLSMDDMHGQGDLGLTRANGRPLIDANLGMDRIDFNAYRAALPQVPLLTLLEDSWSTDTILFDALKDFDARLMLATNEIIYGDLDTGPTRVAAELKDRVLGVKLDNMSLYGGSGRAEIRIDGTQAVPAVAVSFSGNDINSEQGLRGAISFGKIAGKLSTSFSVTTFGSSLAEMVSRLKGQGSFRITDGSVTDMDLVRLIRQATEVIQDSWPLDPSLATPFDALSASYSIDDGIVATQNLVLTGPALAITLRGEIDLARQAFDLTSEPRFATGKGGTGKATQFATLPVPVIVRGPWIGPRIYPDMPGILDDPESAFKALKKLGMGTATIESSAVPSSN